MSGCVECLGLKDPVFTFSVPRRVTSQNAGGSNKGAGMFAYKRERSAWIRDLTTLVKAKVVDEATCRRVVRITREYTGRCQLMDYGNLVGGLKPVVDAMQCEISSRKQTISGAGIIVDDSPQWFIGVYEQHRSDRDAVTFQIWDLPDK